MKRPSLTRFRKHPDGPSIHRSHGSKFMLTLFSSSDKIDINKEVYCSVLPLFPAPACLILVVYTPKGISLTNHYRFSSPVLTCQGMGLHILITQPIIKSSLTSLVLDPRPPNVPPLSLSFVFANLDDLGNTAKILWDKCLTKQKLSFGEESWQSLLYAVSCGNRRLHVVL
ncbi:hypothetical protein BJX99DRAFT_47612 [Aspergillus californicus]